MNYCTKIFVVAALASAMISISGCDQIRKLAGRPTSSDIDGLRLVIRADEQRKDSIRVAAALSEKEKADSIAAFEGFYQIGAYLRKPSDLRGIKDSLAHRYYIAVGAFRQLPNAERFMAKYDSKVYAPCCVRTGAGLNLVLVSPCDKAADIYKAFISLKESALFPKDAWILVSDDNWNTK